MTKIIGATTPTVANNTSLAASVTTATVSTSSLAQFASEDINLTTSKEGCLVSFQASRSCLVRVYSTSAARSGDSRAYNVAVPASGVTGLIAEVEIDTVVANSIVTNIVYANEDSPQAGVLYFKVFNLGSVGVVELDVGNTQFLQTPRTANIENVSTTKNLTLGDAYFQFLAPTVASVIVKLPIVTADDVYEGEIVNSTSGANALVVKESDDTDIITLSNTGDMVRSIYYYWDGSIWRIFERSYY